MACCQRNSGMAPNVLEQVSEKLDYVVFPGAKYACILNGAGEAIVQHTADNSSSKDLMAAIASLKRASLQFASTLNQSDCPVIHLTGETHMFSCYDVGDNLLAFYSEVDGASFSTLDTIDDDRRILDLADEIRLMLQNLTLT